MSSESVIVKLNAPLAVITLNRPQRLNAINRKSIRHIQAAMDEIEADDTIAVVIIRGAGRAFSSGMDLKDDTAAGISGKEDWRRVLEEDLAFLLRF